MSPNEDLTFDCRFYVSGLGPIKPILPYESGPLTPAKISFLPIEFEEMIDPSFRDLVMTFETLPEPLQFVQV